jgi:phage shock protein A
LFNLIANSFALFLGETTPPKDEVEGLLNDLERQITNLQEQIAGVLVQKGCLERSHQAALALAQEAEREAEAALRRDDEEAARAALRRRLPQVRRVEALRAELAEQERVIGDLQKALHLLQTTLVEARGQQDVLLARERRLEAEGLIHQALRRYGPASDLATTLGHADTTLARRQDRLTAAREVEQASLSQQMAELEIKAAITTDLEAIRHRLQTN